METSEFETWTSFEEGSESGIPILKSRLISMMYDASINTYLYRAT